MVSRSWFVSDREWKIRKEDYAVVNSDSGYIRDLINQANNSRPSFTGPCEGEGEGDPDNTRLSYHDFLFHQEEGSGAFDFPIWGNSHLIYGDVNDTKPEHHESLIKRALEEEPLDQEPEQYVALRENLLPKMVNVWRRWRVSDLAFVYSCIP